MNKPSDQSRCSCNCDCLMPLFKQHLHNKAHKQEAFWRKMHMDFMWPCVIILIETFIAFAHDSNWSIWLLAGNLENNVWNVWQAMRSEFQGCWRAAVGISSGHRSLYLLMCTRHQVTQKQMLEWLKMMFVKDCLHYLFILRYCPTLVFIPFHFILGVLQ